jgi:hypothetical protein
MPDFKLSASLEGHGDDVSASVPARSSDTLLAHAIPFTNLSFLL